MYCPFTNSMCGYSSTKFLLRVTSNLVGASFRSCFSNVNIYTVKFLVCAGFLNDCSFTEEYFSIPRTLLSFIASIWPGNVLPCSLKKEETANTEGWSILSMFSTILEPFLALKAIWAIKYEVHAYYKDITPTSPLYSPAKAKVAVAGAGLPFPKWRVCS